MRSFTDVLGDLQAGRVFHELNEELGELVNAVKEHRKAGTLTFTMKVKPNGPNAVEVIDDIKLNIPRAPRGVTILFVGEDGSLTREDPRQIKMELKEVQAPEKELKEAVEPEPKPLREAATA